MDEHTLTEPCDADIVRPPMGKQIREVSRVKLAFAKKHALGPVDRLRMYGGIASLGAYWLATRIGLRRAT